MPTKQDSYRIGQVVRVGGRPAVVTNTSFTGDAVFVAFLDIHRVDTTEVEGCIPGYDSMKLAAAVDNAGRRGPRYSPGDVVCMKGKAYRVIRVSGGGERFSEVPVQYTVTSETQTQITEDELDHGVDELATSATQQLASFQSRAVSKVINENDNDCFAFE